ncbi:MAG TPA: lysylphosphatidylglycerol synthase domain-containing protein [Nocardioidaceae bacterium]|nr:lysylphosphatidylglycerol synthase domain-containing protein [Nocardioidaceae bacterium]
MRRHLLLTLQVAVPLACLALLAYRFGPDAFRSALAVVSPVPLLAALLLGGAAVGAQAARWRVVMRGAGLPLGFPEALAECYRSCALNTVLPGGIAGDVLRAWRQRTGAPRGWRPGAVSVLAERAAGLCVLLGAAAAVLLIEAPPAYPAAVAAALACVAWAVSRPSLRRLSLRDRAAVWAWSVLGLLALLGMAAVATATIGVADGPGVVLALGLVLLAGAAVPLNLGGWGPREAAGALAAVLVGVPPAAGVTLAVGFGLLATVSVLPGFLVLGIRRPVRSSRDGARQVELHTHVVTEHEPPRRRPKGVRQPVTALEPQAGHAIADQQRSGGHQ